MNRFHKQIKAMSEDECEYENEQVNVTELAEEILVRTRRLLLTGEITESVSAHICSYLQVFSLVDKPIYMYINSPGGCLSSGYAIIDQMLATPCPIVTIVRGQANSMGAMIAAYGTKNKRFITKNSSMMLHSVILQHPIDSIERHAEMLRYVEADYKQKVTDLSRRTKLSVSKLKELMSKTKWMTPQEAIDVGIVDGIWTPKMEKDINKGKQA